MAKHKRPQYLHVYKDRHGTERIYFNRPGFPKAALPGLLYSEEFWTAYHKAKAGTLPKPMEIGATRTIPGSMSDLIGKYFKAPEFKSLGETTQKVVRRQLDAFREKHGHRPVRGFERKHAKAIIGDMSDRMGAANNLLKRLKVLTRFAVDIGMLKIDPLIGMKGFKYEAKGFHTWTDDEIEQYEKRHPQGTKAHLAMALMLYTGQRRSDAVRLGRQHLKGDRILVRQQKTKALIDIPVHPKLRAAIDALPCENMTFLTTEQKRPFTANGFGNWMRDRCDEAGLPDCSSHGLRKAMATRLAEAGCTNKEIAAITGHTTDAQVNLYTKAASQKLLSNKAMQALQESEQGTKSATPKPAVSKSGS